MIKAVVCDLDETLLNHEKEITTANMDAIQRIKEAGILFIPATGRPYSSAVNTLEILDHYGQDDGYSITYNGGMIHHSGSDVPLHMEHLDYDLANWLFKFGQKESVCIQVYTDDCTYIYAMNDDERQYCRLFSAMKEIDEADDLSFVGKSPVVKVLFQNLDLTYLQALADQLPLDIKEQLEISFSSNRYLEINPKGVSKGNVLTQLANRLDISLSEILTIGDNNNDLSMLSITGHSGAPSNAHQSVKDIAAYISPYSCEESAVADIINHHIK